MKLLLRAEEVPLGQDVSLELDGVPGVLSNLNRPGGPLYIVWLDTVEKLQDNTEVLWDVDLDDLREWVKLKSGDDEKIHCA